MTEDDASERRTKEPEAAPGGGVQVCVVHAQASTGGTLFARCLAALPDALLLNELSPAGTAYNRFSPIDPFEQALARPELGYEATVEKRMDMFCDRLRPLLEHAGRRGLALIIREHSHSETMINADPGLTLRAALARMGVTPKSLLLVRYPLASYMTARTSNFLRPVGTLQTYCENYSRFVATLPSVPRIRYEDFSFDPENCMRKVCETFGIGFDPDMLARFSRISLSGNSGRFGGDNHIHPSLLRPAPPAAYEAATETPAYRELCSALGYPGNPVEFAISAAKAVLAFNPLDAAAAEELERLRKIASS